MTKPELGVIGGSGFYSLFDDATEVEVDTPYGPPSAPLTIGTVGGRSVAFVPRHGVNHEYPPHKVNFRANLWAMHHLGVARLVAPCAVGSLQPDINPGDVVVCDQFVDRTWGRLDTYFDGPTINHVSLADPYCRELRTVALDALASHGIAHHATGTVVVVQGPRFSTRAESAWYRSAGWSVINMTQYPEVTLARELGVCYLALALVTDRDAGDAASEPVNMAAVFETLSANVERTRQLLQSLIPMIPATARCQCAGVDR
jgi:5'-methylthioadenosine phosphorylase